ncbi:MAG: D-glycero-beta-D-manno-heptose 1,7-bisphosphate 7-phosphatase, partial [Elusimicrobiota bacterium]
QELKSTPRAVMLGCHLGNWEITGMETVARGIELYSIAKRIHTTAIDLLVNELRTVFGGGVLSDRGGVRAVLKKLKKNKRVYILFDQRINRGIPVKFFNRPVWGTHIVSILNRSTSAAVIPCYSEISKRGVDVFYEKPFDMLSEGDPLRADFINTQNQFLWLEDKIRSDPGSWYWVHNFWKPGKKGWKAVFLDRDGTINVDKGYVVKKKDLEFIPGVFEALRKLRKAGFLLIVVTNQSGIARGYYSQLDYRRFNDYFQEALFREGVIIDRVFHCPHHPDEGCLCRKPGTEMIERAAEELNINMEGSFMVGDKDSDISAGKKAGLRTVSLGDAIGPGTEADFNARTPLEAGEFILNQSRET